MTSFAPVHIAFSPPIPQTTEELGIPESLVLDLVLRRMVIEGYSNLETLGKALRLSVPVVDKAFKYLRAQQMVDVKGMKGNDYNFVLSAAGKQLASERFQVSQYAGACPVSLKAYQAAVKKQAAKINVDRDTLRNAFSDLIVTDRMLDALGPAIISQSSIFVYGPTGNGKTSLA
jgi:hypothetical protein